MSFIKKIVEIVDRSDNVDARKNIAKLNKDIKSYQEKVKSYIDSNYAEFLPCIISNESLLEEGSHIGNDLTSLKQNLANETNNMYQANDEISRLLEELEEVNVKLSLSMKLVKIDKMLEKIRLHRENENFSEIGRILDTIQLIVNDPENKIIRRLDMYKNLKIRLSNERDDMLKSLEVRWKSLVQIKEKNFLKTRSVTINISSDTSKLTQNTNAIVEAGYDFKDTVEFFMDRVFEPLVSRPVSLDFSQNEKGFIMNISHGIEPITDELRPIYSDVFTSFSKIMEFMQNMNVPLAEGDSEFFLQRIFQNRHQHLLDMIFTQCLVHSIPKTFDEKKSSTMKQDIAQLGQILAEHHFMPATDISKLETYAAKTDELFFEQFTKNIQASASDLLKRDLHDMMLISEDTTISTDTPMTFPRSMVSKSTLELVRLLEKIILQAQGSPNDLERQHLMQSIKTVVENFSFTVQMHHSKFMSKIPQQSALFYNNCMYLSNWVTRSCDTENVDGMERVVEDLEKQGWEVLECQIAKQKIQLLEILTELDPQQSINAVKPEHFKPIRQCLRQMDLLKNVWQTILPYDLYNKTMSGLLDVISLDLTRKVAIMEDISTILANGLVELIKNVDEKGQSLFEADVSVLNIVPSWQRMIHLQFILDASLVDITNSWKADQISQSFKAEDVKRLIRALFQNTDRRANALSSIV